MAARLIAAALIKRRKKSAFGWTKERNKTVQPHFSFLLWSAERPYFLELIFERKRFMIEVLIDGLQKDKEKGHQNFNHEYARSKSSRKGKLCGRASVIIMFS